MSNLVTGKVRFSYANVFEPRAIEGGDEKYSVTILIPKTDTNTYQNIINEMNKTLNDATASAFGGVRPNNPKFPIYDGDGLRPSGEMFGEECKGHWVITANTKERPEIVDANLNPIMSKSNFYSGCYGRVSLGFYAYNKNGNKGVGCGLGNLQKLEDGQALSGRTSASEDFAAFGPAPATNYQVPGQPVNTANVYNQPQPVNTVNPYNQAVDPITGQPILNNMYGVQ